jgi:hypothetical protein
MDPLIPAIVSTVIQTLMSMPSDPPPVADTLARPIPVEAASARMQPSGNGQVALDGTAYPLSPGAQIRDPQNRIVQPVAVQESARVRYLTDATGAVHRIWILGPDETGRLSR